jgi:hypothetical protein
MMSLRHLVGNNKKQVSFIAGLLVVAAGLLGAVGFTASRAYAAVDCDNNAIIKCGFSSPTDFINKVKVNDSLNGHHDLQAIYNYFGLTSAQYSDFISHAVLGEARRNGDIVVNGQVVATGATSIGRIASYHGSNYFTKNIGGVNYYGNVNDKTFAPGVQSIPVYVWFDEQGTMKLAVMGACGNPDFGNVVKTSASCSALTQTPVAGKTNTYDFTASAAKTGNATIKTFVYDFGDGSPTVSTTDGAKAVRHTYTKAGTYTASVTVYASVPGNANLKLPSVSLCTKTITVKLPFYECVQLVGRQE